MWLPIVRDCLTIPGLGVHKELPLGWMQDRRTRNIRCDSVILICLLPQIRLHGITLVDREQPLK